MAASPLADRALAQPSLPSLAVSQPESSPHPQSEQAVGAGQLWLCAWFPALSLESAGRYPEDGDPFAVVMGSGSRRVIYMATAAATAAGITTGMPLGQAYALCPRLATQSRDTASEAHRLSRLAVLAGRFTSRVSLRPPQALMLEIGSSLRLFRGLAALKAQLVDDLTAMGTQAHIAVTPAPTASQLLASQGQNVEVLEREHLQAALGRLPVHALPLEAQSIQCLNNISVRCLHDLWRLPREGLARRFTPALLGLMDRALGLRPEPGPPVFHLPPHFEAALELPQETIDATALLAAARSLIDKLIRFLRTHDTGISRLYLEFRHQHAPPTPLTIGTRYSRRDGAHLLGLLREHLNHLRLSAPVLEVHLSSTAIEPYAAHSGELFAKREASDPDHHQSGLAKQRLLERLRARLGRAAVQGLAGALDYRPEYAWRRGGTEEGVVCQTEKLRPLWLLSRPRPLPAHESHPWRRGRLQLSPEPERIESGWWDGRPMRRDYYLAWDSDGSRLWVFRDLGCDPGHDPGHNPGHDPSYDQGRGQGGQQHAWYLHGLFG